MRHLAFFSRRSVVFLLPAACFSPPTSSPEQGESGVARADTEASSGSGSGGGVDSAVEATLSWTTDLPSWEGATSGGAPSNETEPALCGEARCSGLASCVEGRCVCNSGYSGDGVDCRISQTCASDPCFPGVRCVETASGYACGDCPAGYVGDGISCEDADSCSEMPCFEGVTCQDIAAPEQGRICGPCPPGYSGDGETCTELRCEPEPCFPGVPCSERPETPMGFECGACPEGFYGDGVACFEPRVFAIREPSITVGQSPNRLEGNGYGAADSGTIVEFEVYLQVPTGGCVVDFYVFRGATSIGGVTQVYRGRVEAGSGEGYVSSGQIDVVVESGDYYVLAAGWGDCLLHSTYSRTVDCTTLDAGLGAFENVRYDSDYELADWGPAYTPPSSFPSTSVGCYVQRVHWAGR